MNEILQSVIDLDFVTFNTKFKDKMSKKYEEDIGPIKTEFNKTVFNEMVVNDDKGVKCKNCGKELPVGQSTINSCPFCGDLVLKK